MDMHFSIYRAVPISPLYYLTNLQSFLIQQHFTFYFYFTLTWRSYINLIQDLPFWDCSKMGGEEKRPPFPKICYAYPTMMKLGTVISYLKKIQKIYESWDAPLEFY